MVRNSVAFFSWIADWEACHNTMQSSVEPMLATGGEGLNSAVAF